MCAGHTARERKVRTTANRSSVPTSIAVLLPTVPLLQLRQDHGRPGVPDHSCCAPRRYCAVVALLFERPLFRHALAVKTKLLIKRYSSGPH